MPFIKTGTPQPMTVVDCMCEVCQTQKASMRIDGKMVCATCGSEMKKDGNSEPERSD